MAIRLIIHSRAKAGKGKEYVEAFMPIVKETRSEPGCEQYELYVSASDPDKVALLERWSDQEKLDAHMVIMRKRDMSRNAALREGEATRERYDNV